MGVKCLLLESNLPQSVLDQLKARTTLIKVDDIGPNDDLNDIEVIVASPVTGVDNSWFDKLPHLRLITLYGVGTDKVDLKQARKRHIDVTITQNILTRDVADMAMALLLAVSRNIVKNDQFIRHGNWQKGAPIAMGTSLEGKKLGVVGLGAIGKAIATRAEAFAMAPAYYSRQAKTDVAWPYFSDITALAAYCDILVVCLSATPQTRHIINRPVFEALGRQGYLINIARGAVICENDLIAALTQGEIAGAGLDVFHNEPDIDPRFFALSQVVLAPHQGSATVETRLAMAQSMLANICAYLDKQPIENIIN